MQYALLQLSDLTQYPVSNRLFFIFGALMSTRTVALDDSVQLTIAIPMFNAARFIQQTLESVLNQTEQDFEIIVCDDVSTDQSVEIVQQMIKIDPRIKLLQNEINKGPSFSRNRAMSAASGKWIALLDADDFYHKDRLKDLVKLGEENNADFIADNIYRVDINAENPMIALSPAYTDAEPLVITTASFIDNNSSIKKGFKYGYLQPIMRRSFLVEHNIKYDESTRMGEDFMFSIESLLKGAKFILTYKAYYYYRVVSSSLSGELDNSIFKENNSKLILLAKSLHQENIIGILETRQKEYEHIAIYRDIVNLIKKRQLLEAIFKFMNHPSAWAICLTLAGRYINKMVLVSQKDDMPDW
jgi:succinoglycan biosynthesis protein ExoO